MLRVKKAKGFVSRSGNWGGVEAYSCDIIDCSGIHPEWHIKADVIPLLNGNCCFKTSDGTTHYIDKWDAIIAFPPCTHLAVSGARHFEKKRADGRQYEGIEFLCKFFDADCDYIMIENPVNIIMGNYCKEWFPSLAEKYKLPRRPQQIIQPWMFGDPFEKKTCLWLKGFPPLKSSNIVSPPERTRYESGKSLPTWYADLWRLPKDERAKQRSKTFPGIAAAIASQYSDILITSSVNNQHQNSYNPDGAQGIENL